MSNKNAGFTFVEIIIALSIIAILMSFALPSYQEFSARQKINNITNELITDLNFAKSSSINFGQQIVVLSTNNNDWSEGWNVFIDNNKNFKIDVLEEKVLLTKNLSSSRIRLVTNLANYIGFNNMGSAFPDVNNYITVGHSDTSTEIVISISASGAISSKPSI